MSIFDLVNRFDKKKMDQAKAEWREENYDFGISLGYPECCVEQFCNEPPLFLKNTKRRIIDVDRYNSAFINGEYTGFIPCDKHATEIISGKLLLQDLVQNRDDKFRPFPDTLL